MRPEPHHFLAGIKKTCKLDEAKTKSSEHAILSILHIICNDNN